MRSGFPLELVFWIGALIGAFILLWLGVTLGTRLMKRDDGGGQPPPPITLASAERMRAAGQLTEEEFRAVREAVIAAAARADDPKTAAVRAQVESLRPRTGGVARARRGYDMAGDPLPTPDEGGEGGENAGRPDSG